MKAVTSKQGPSESPGAAEAGGGRRLHLDWLDGLRGLAALYVVFHHIAGHITGPGKHIRHLPINPLFGFGHYAVDVFIVLSGFCLMIPISMAGGVLKGGAKNFFARRALRILPTYYAALALSAILGLTIISAETNTHWDASLPVDGRSILAHLFLLQDVWKSTSASINHVMWSISVEWRIYFLFPLMVIAAQRYGALKTTIVAVLGSYAVWGVLTRVPQINTNPVGTSPYYVGLFALGMLACDWSLGQNREQSLGKKPILFGTAFIALLVAVFSFGKFGGGRLVPLQFMSLFVGLSTAGLLLAVGRGYLPRIGKLLSWKPIVVLGTFGYSLYLFHAPLIQVLWLYVVKPMNLAVPKQEALLYALSPVIVGGCYVFYLLFEKPVTKMLARRKVSKA